MGLEAFSGWIKDLVSTNPTGGDPVSQGDDHLRGIKATLQQQFSGLTENLAVTVLASELNQVPATTARANACLPKDGSEFMTGPLQVRGSITALSETTSRAIQADVLESPNSDGLTVRSIRDDGLATHDLIFVGMDAVGNPQYIELGRLNLPFRTANTLTIDVNDARVASTAFVVLNSRCFQNRNGAPIAVGGAPVEICRTVAPLGGVNQVHAMGSASFTIGGALATVTLILEICRLSDDVVLDSFTALQTGGDDTRVNLSVMAGAIGTGVEVYARILASCDQLGATVAAQQGMVLLKV